MSVSEQFNPAVENFQTLHPEGKNSVYTRLPDNRWARNKTAAGELHIAGNTRFVHPQYGESKPHPVAGVRNYSPLELAAAHGELVTKTGEIQHKVVGSDGKSTAFSIPAEHISNDPKPGWIPVEHTMKKDNSGLKSYHLGHPVAPFTRENFRS